MYSENTINKLIHMGLFTEEEISEEEFMEHEDDLDSDKIYIVNYDEYSGKDRYKVIDTYGLTADEIMMNIQLEQTNNLNLIKGMLIFFVVLAIIGILIGIVCGYNVSNAFK